VFLRELGKPARRGKPARPPADDDDVEFHRFSFARVRHRPPSGARAPIVYQSVGPILSAQSDIESPFAGNRRSSGSRHAVSRLLERQSPDYLNATHLS
jgi:hypothetical protein